MSNKYFFSNIILTLFLFLFIGLSSNASQDSSNKKNEEPNYFFIKSYYEKALGNINKDKGEDNNWMNRWLWNNRLDINPDGSFKYFDEQFQPSSNKELKENNSRLLSETGWVPVGPINIPPTYEPRSCYCLGRINCLAFHPQNPSIFWIGTPGGGVWKTENSGQSWTPQTDNLPTLAVSDIAVDPQNPDIVYFASGDFDTGGMSNRDALGIFKSTDGGLSWTQTSLSKDKNFRRSMLRKIIINPDTPNQIITAGTYGIWKSSDAGATWYFICDSLVTDLEKDPLQPEIIYAATGTYANYYGTASIIKSTDFGETWQLLNTGIPPKGEVSRVDIAVSPADPNYIYALAVNSTNQRGGGLHSFYLSTDAGETWQERANFINSTNMLGAYSGDSNDVRGQGTYDLVLLPDPYDKNKVYTGGVNIWMSENGGTDWEMVSFWIYCFGPSIHADHHYAAYNPIDKYFYWCNDGGIYRTHEILPGSKDWISQWVDKYTEDAKPGHPDFKFPTVWENLTNGLAITEFYKLSLCRDYSGYIAGGSQDNSCFYHQTGDWVNYIANYDGMETMIDYKNPETIYGVWQFGGLCKSTDGGKNIVTRLADTITSQLKESGNWITPVAMDPVNPNIIYIGFRNLWRSRYGGYGWEKAFNLDSLAHDSSNKASLSIIKISDNNPNYISIYKEDTWVYIKDTKQYKHLPGEFWITKDGGESWSLTTEGLPIDTMDIVDIDYDLNNPEKMWVVFNSYFQNINTFMTADGGLTWKDVSKPLPNVTAKTIVHQATSTANTLYIGTNHGVYFTEDSLDMWVPFGENLPNAIISKLEIDKTTRELFAATYGRGIWKTELLPDDINEAALPVISLNISPNPSNGNFTLNFSSDDLYFGKQINIKVIDIIGRIIFEENEIAESNSFKKDFKIKTESGVFFIQVNLDGRSYVAKIIIKK